MVKIGRYKGYEVKYSNDEFKAYKGRKVITRASTEKVLRSQIDHKLKQAKEEEALKQKLAKEAEKAADLTKQHYVFDLKSLAKTITSVTDIVTETTLWLENGELNIVQMDPANVCMIITSCPYTGSKGPTEITINATNLSNALNNSFAKFDEEEVTMTFSPGEKETLYMNLKNNKNELTIEGYKPENQKNKVPQLKHMSKHNIRKSELAKAVTACKEIGDGALTFRNKNKKLELSIHEERTKYEVKDLSTGTGEDCSSKFSIGYVKLAVTGKKPFLTGNELTVHLSQDYPLVIEDEYGDTFILAPRVDND